ncbi:hypothetical protein PV325_001406 [Microctonus aethiopoides]|nr:hypothetical protein PV325_001406 [Microctonus aethiopoides]
MDVHAMESSQNKLGIVMKHKRNINPKMKKFINNMNHSDIERLKRAVRKPSRWAQFERELAHYLQTEKNLPPNLTSDHLVSFLIHVQNLKSTEKQIIRLQMKIIEELSRRVSK